ncbi:MAG TPA: ATP-grasp domain-containing protein, partial [Chromatiaceae bacterium]|nr:ATP-grasp domain-containing protein [Chromatiaceae bacterium]
MNLHEYQAKGLFARHGIPVPRSLTVALASEARAATDELGGERWVVKAQVHSGARGKAGGVVLTESIEQVARETERLVGTRLRTHQTGPEGLPIGQVLIETPTDSVRELYLGALVDREAKRVVIMASADGGMDIEEVAAKTPERILTTHVHPAVG